MIITTAETTEANAARDQLQAANAELANLQRRFRPEAEKAPVRKKLTAARVRWHQARYNYFLAYGRPLV